MNTVAINTTEEIEVKKKSEKNLLWLGIGAMVMFFAALTSGYIVRRGEGNWQFIDLPITFYLSTAAILFSSISMNWAVSSIRKTNKRAFLIAIIVTFILGCVFFSYQILSFNDLISRGFHFSHKGMAASEWLYVIIFLHMLHVIAGYIVLTVVFVKGINGKYNHGNFHGVQLCAIFWHFLDFMWLYLFLFFLFFR